MPKFFYDEETLQQWYFEAQEAYPDIKEADPDVEDLEPNFEAVVTGFHREADQRLSTYEPAQCSIDEADLEEISHLALRELRRVGVARLIVDYDGGHDEGLARFRAAQTEDEEKDLKQTAQFLEEGPLGDAPSPQPNARYFDLRTPPQWTRLEWALFKIEYLTDALASQLLGERFGVGEFSLEGTFVVDLRSGTLTDVAPHGE